MKKEKKKQISNFPQLLINCGKHWLLKTERSKTSLFHVKQAFINHYFSIIIVAMKKIGWVLTAIVLFCLFSCSNPQGIVLTSQEDTLRNEVEILSGQMVWSNEIEPERLSTEINDKVTASLLVKVLVKVPLLSPYTVISTLFFPSNR